MACIGGWHPEWPLLARYLLISLLRAGFEGLGREEVRVALIDWAIVLMRKAGGDPEVAESRLAGRTFRGSKEQAILYSRVIREIAPARRHRWLREKTLGWGDCAVVDHRVGWWPSGEDTEGSAGSKEAILRELRREKDPRKRKAFVLFTDWATIPQVADVLRISESTVRRYRRDWQVRLAGILRERRKHRE